MKAKNFSRKTWISAILTVLMPGLGQIYNGELKKGLLFYCLTILISVSAIPLLLFHLAPPVNLILVLLVVPVIDILLIVQAISYTKSLKGEYKIKPFNRWYLYLTIWVLSTFMIIPSVRYVVKANLVEAYVIPTGAMENTIMAGDYIIGDKRKKVTADPKQGDVIIFKYPRDELQKYVKRSIAEPGQTVEVRQKKVFVDGREFILPPDGKFVNRSAFAPGVRQTGIFLRNEGNRDNLGPIRVPEKGDVIPVNLETNWDYLLPIMIMDGHEVSVRSNSQSRTFEFTMRDPNDIARRYTSGPGRPKKLDKLFRNYYSQDSPDGRLLNVWNFKFGPEIIRFLQFDGKPFESIHSYVVEQDYYWMMGDNRDDSADSRYWGFVPYDLIVGKVLYIYWSKDPQTRTVRRHRMGIVIS